MRAATQKIFCPRGGAGGRVAASGLCSPRFDIPIYIRVALRAFRTANPINFILITALPTALARSLSLSADCYCFRSSLQRFVAMMMMF